VGQAAIKLPSAEGIMELSLLGTFAPWRVKNEKNYPA